MTTHSAWPIASSAITATPPALECPPMAPTLRFHSDAVISLTGAETAAQARQTARPDVVTDESESGSGVACRPRHQRLPHLHGNSQRIGCPRIPGSRSTFVLGQFGGHAGRILRTGDMLRISNPRLAGCRTLRPRITARPALRNDSQLFRPLRNWRTLRAAWRARLL